MDINKFEQTLIAVKRTLNSLEMKSTEANCAYMTSTFNALNNLLYDLSQESQKDNIKGDG